MGARAGEFGIDYAIGAAHLLGIGVGRLMVAALVDQVRKRHPGVGIVADPSAENIASRRVLEKNGFALEAGLGVAGRVVYRLAATSPDQL